MARLWGLFAFARRVLPTRREGKDTGCADRGRVEIRRALPEIAIGFLLHRTVVVARCGSTDPTASAMIETLGAE